MSRLIAAIAFRAYVVTRPLDSIDGLVSRLPITLIRSALGAVEHAPGSSRFRPTRPGVLRHELQHYAYRDISHHLATIDRYTTLAAEQWLAEGRRTSGLGMFFIRDSHSFETTSCAAVSATAPRASRVEDEFLYVPKLAKLWELQHGVNLLSPPLTIRNRRFQSPIGIAKSAISNPQSPIDKG